MKKINEFQTQIYKKYQYFGYAPHFEGVYKFMGAISFSLLGISAIFSAKFFEGFFVGIFGSEAFWAGLLVSAGLALGIGLATHKFLVYWHYQRLFEPVLGGFLVGLIALNIYADFNGAPEIANSIVGQPPADQKASEISGIYTPQISSIDAEIDQIESKHFYWCATHNKAHKCSEASYYVHPKQDRKHVARIEALKEQKASLLSDQSQQLKNASDAHMALFGEYQSKLSKNRNRFKFGALICTLFFMCAQIWRLNYGVRFVNESEKKSETATVSFEAEEAWERLVAQSPELAEEILARREAEGKQRPPA